MTEDGSFETIAQSQEVPAHFRAVVDRHKLAPGSYYIIPRGQTEFLLRVYTEKPLLSRYQFHPTNIVLCMTGKWRTKITKAGKMQDQNA